MTPFDIQIEFARIVGRWTADPDEAEAILDWLYETESILSHEEPQSPGAAEGAFDDRIPASSLGNNSPA